MQEAELKLATAVLRAEIIKLQYFLEERYNCSNIQSTWALARVIGSLKEELSEEFFKEKIERPKNTGRGRGSGR